MAVYPTITSQPVEPINIITQWNTKISTLNSGIEYRRAGSGRCKRIIKLKYEKITASDMNTLWNFYNSMKGSLIPFYFKFPYTEDWSNEYLKKGDNRTNVVSLHCADYTTVTYPIPTERKIGSSIFGYTFKQATPVAAQINNKLYFFGGILGSGSLSNKLFWFDCNTLTGGAQTISSIPARYQPSIVAYNNKVYIYGGRTFSSYLNDFWEVDVNTYTATPKTVSGITARQGCAYCVIGNKMYIYGGVNSSSYLSELWECDLSTFTWTQKTGSGYPQFRCAFGVYNNKLYTWGGDTTGGAQADRYLRECDLTTFTWTTKTQSNDVSRGYPAAVVYNGNFWVLNRYWNINILSCDLSTFTWTQRNTPTIKNVNLSTVGLYNNKGYVFGGRQDFSTTYYSHAYEYNLDIPSITTSGEGMKQLTYTNPVPQGHVITGSFTQGTPMILVRFGEDNLSRDVFSLLLQTTGITLQEVLV